MVIVKVHRHVSLINAHDTVILNSVIGSDRIFSRVHDAVKAYILRLSKLADPLPQIQIGVPAPVTSIQVVPLIPSSPVNLEVDSDSD